MRSRAGPFGLAHGASFNEIDRAVIEMRTKLVRDNTRPLISAARVQRTRLRHRRRRAGGKEASFVCWFVRSRVYTFPRISRVRSYRSYPFPRVRQVLRASKRDLTNCLRFRRREAAGLVHSAPENGRLACRHRD